MDYNAQSAALADADADAKDQWREDAKKQWIAEMKARWDAQATSQLMAEAEARVMAAIEKRWTAEDEAGDKARWKRNRDANDRRLLDKIVEQFNW